MDSKKSNEGSVGLQNPPEKSKNSQPENWAEFAKGLALGEEIDIDKIAEDKDNALDDIVYLIKYSERNFPDLEDIGRIRIAEAIEKLRSKYEISGEEIENRLAETYPDSN